MIYPIKGLIMRLFGTIKLANFVQVHASSRGPLAAWQLEAEEASWSDPQDVKARYLDAVVEPRRVVFNIKDLYKIDVTTRYERGVLLVENVWAVTLAPKLRRSANSTPMRSRA